MTRNFLKNPAHAGIYILPASHQPTLAEQAKQAHLVFFDIDLGQARTIDKLLAKIGQALAFPDWYGNNFDALHDCLCDPEWRQERSIAICIRGLGRTRAHAPEAVSTLIEVLGSVVGERSSKRPPLWILLDAPCPGIDPLPEA